MGLNIHIGPLLPGRSPIFPIIAFLNTEIVDYICEKSRLFSRTDIPVASWGQGLHGTIFHCQNQKYVPVRDV